MSNGAFIGSKILHNALINHNLDSKILSDAIFKKEINEKNNDNQQKKTQEPRRIITKKIGRNEPCPCGSGKKYKQCHGS